MSTRRALTIAAVFAVALLALHVQVYLPFLSDDALISLRYARRLLEGHGLTWTDGPRVEGYSNLLWLLAVAALGGLGLDLIAAARLLGFASMALVFASLAAWFGRRAPESWLPAALALLLLALAAPTAIWAIGGLEQPLLAALLALSLPLAFQVLEADAPRPRATWWLGLLFGLVCWTRPDGPLFAVAFAASFVLLHPVRRWRPLLPVLGVAFLLWSAQLGFRLVYYGDWVPNPARVKLAATDVRWLEGLRYVWTGLWALAPFSWLALAAMGYGLLREPLRARSLLLSTMSVTWLGYVAFIGGDIFPGSRHFVPVLVLFAFALADAGAELLPRLPVRAPAARLAALSLAALMAAFVGLQLWHPQNRRAVNERWEWRGKALALLLKDGFAAEQPLLAVTASGCLPYWSELPALDMLGLNDAYLPRHPPPDFGRGPLSHELGSGAYVLERQPDLIVFHVGSPEPMFRSGAELAGLREFAARYAPVRLRVSGPPAFDATLFARRESPRLGFREDARRLSLPAVLLADGSRAALERAPSGRLALPVTADQTLRWDQQASDFEIGSVEIRGSGADAAEALHERQGERVVIRVRATSGKPVWVESLELTKLPR